MESIASNSSPSRGHRPMQPSQPIADRIHRAIRHGLRLLHRVDADFFILGATGNVYTVTLATTPTCTCPDRTTPCKHILFVLIKVLGVSTDAPCLRRRTLRPCQLNQLLVTPILVESLAGASLQLRFHQLHHQQIRQQRELQSGSSSNVVMEIQDGTTCLVCLEEMERGDKAASCGTCCNLIHEECLMKWRRSRGRKYANCVVCRARWDRPTTDKDRYINLSAYVSDEDDHTDAAAGAPPQDVGSHCGDSNSS